MTDPFTPLSIRPELSTTTTPSLLHSFPGEHVASIHPLTPRFILLLSPFLFLFPPIFFSSLHMSSYLFPKYDITCHGE